MRYQEHWKIYCKLACAILVFVTGFIIASHVQNTTGVFHFYFNYGQTNAKLTTVSSRILTTVSPRILFYFFPQWHSMPENNRNHFWDFTDWDLIKKIANNSQLSCKNIQQPTELGWYNLLSYRVRKSQSKLLREHGGYGFIYHVYWFTDHPVMDEPMRQVLADKDIDTPYMVSWANEPWYNRWFGGDGRMTMKMDVSSEADRRKFFQYLLPFFLDPRYIRVQGKPVFQAYKADENMKLVFKDFKQWAIEAGLPGLHCHQTLAHFHGARFNPYKPQDFHIPVSSLVDGVTEFQPNLIHRNKPDYWLSSARIPRHHSMYHWRGLFVDWDNGPRNRRCSPVRSHPFYFEIYLREIVTAMQNDTRMHSLVPEDQYVAVNAWNEWSEGNTMEPSNIYGRGYLEALQTVVMTRVENSKVCILLAASDAETPFTNLSSTISSFQIHLIGIQWETLVYSTHPQPNKPLELMNHIRNTTDRRIRVIDIPPRLQQGNTTGYDMLRYLLPHCHDVRTSHYAIFLQAGDKLTEVPRVPSDWKNSWNFSFYDCNSKTKWRNAERIGLLETNKKFAKTFALNWAPFNTCITS